jgi:hypothetical protein
MKCTVTSSVALTVAAIAGLFARPIERFEPLRLAPHFDGMDLMSCIVLVLCLLAAAYPGRWNFDRKLGTTLAILTLLGFVLILPAIQPAWVYPGRRKTPRPPAIRQGGEDKGRQALHHEPTPLTSSSNHAIDDKSSHSASADLVNRKIPLPLAE